MMERSRKLAENEEKAITILPEGPYLVTGGIPFAVKTQIVSEYGEPLTWKTERTPDFKADYALCRCGQSGRKPYCDGTHCEVEFDGTETADTGPGASDPLVFPRGTRIVVKKDPDLCMNSGFCGTRDAGMKALVAASSDTKVRSLIIAMVERCPSGALTYSMEPGEPDIEPDLPQQIANTIEITSDGPIAGPLWVTGCIPIERADGEPFEPRNRVTLCNCGMSSNKPLCDGTHREEAEREAKRCKQAES